MKQVGKGIYCAVCLLGMVPAWGFAQKINIDLFCPKLAGHWQGTAANADLEPVEVTTQIMCSADKRNMYITVSRGSRFSNSETWWLQQRDDHVVLVYSNGVTDSVIQHFTLYEQSGSYSLLGKGEINQRPALVQLAFEPIMLNKRFSGWQWQQSAHYLDDDSSQYQVVRAIDLLPAL